MADDRLRAASRRHFSLMLHPHVPVLQSLIEADDKLNAAVGFLESLSPDVEAEREQGMVVVSVAIGYALKLLEYHGLVDGPAPPMPADLAQAKQAVDKLLAFVRQNVELGWMAEGQAVTGDTEQGQDEDTPPDEEPTARDESRLVVDQAMFSARYRIKECVLGNSNESRLL